MVPDAPLFVPLTPPVLRRWQTLAGWTGLVIAAGLILLAAWFRPRHPDNATFAAAFAGLMLFVAAVAFAARSYRVVWAIDPVAKTATRRRILLGMTGQRVYAAADLGGIRVWFRAAGKDYPSMYLAGFASGPLLTSGYAYEEVRRAAAATGERLGLPVADETY